MDILPGDSFLTGTSNIQLVRWVVPRDETVSPPEGESALPTPSIALFVPTREEEKGRFLPMPNED